MQDDEWELVPTGGGSGTDAGHSQTTATTAATTTATNPFVTGSGDINNTNSGLSKPDIQALNAVNTSSASQSHKTSDTTRFSAIHVNLGDMRASNIDASYCETENRSPYNPANFRAEAEIELSHMASWACQSSGSPLTASVSNLTQQCFEEFQAAMRSKINRGYQDPLDSRLADFNLWVDNVGAMAKSGASLDSRFRSRPDDLTLVKNILIMLSDFLTEYTDAVTKHLPITEAFMNIDSAIRNLAMIGVAIRRTGKASRSRRANQSFNPDEHREIQRHLECLVLLRPSKDQPQLDGLGISNIDELINSISAESNEQNVILATKLEQLATSRIEELDSSRLNEIQKRLIEANLRRRHNFLLAQKRSQRARKIVQGKITADKHDLKLILSKSRK